MHAVITQLYPSNGRKILTFWKKLGDLAEVVQYLFNSWKYWFKQMKSFLLRNFEHLSYHLDHTGNQIYFVSGSECEDMHYIPQWVHIKCWWTHVPVRKPSCMATPTYIFRITEALWACFFVFPFNTLCRLKSCYFDVSEQYLEWQKWYDKFLIRFSINMIQEIIICSASYWVQPSASPNVTLCVG